MANLNEHEIEAISKFYQGFTTSWAKFMSQSLDKDVYKKIDLSVASVDNISEIESLKDSTIFYEVDYAKGSISSSLALVISEEFVASATDVMTGGTGEGAYKGSLSEVDVNSFSDFLKKLFKENENLFKINYNKDLAFNPKPKFLLKEMPEFEEAFSQTEYDLIVNFKLLINETQEASVFMLMKVKDIKQTLSDLNLLKDSGSVKFSDIDTISLEQLSDVKINITAELGRTRIPLKYALELVRGSLVELDTLNNADIKVFANGVEVAMAQVVVVEDNFGLRMTKIITPEERLKSIR